MPCNRPANSAVSGLMLVRRRAITQLRLATSTLRFHNMPSGASNPFNSGASRSCRTAKAIVAERTVSNPTRDTALRKSVTRAPAGFRAAELAMRTIWEASTGSLPSTLTTRLLSAFSSPSTFCTRMTMCGKPGNSILPPDSSDASACTKVNATSPGPVGAAVGVVSCASVIVFSRERSGTQRLPQGFDLLFRLVNELLVAGPVDFHPLAGGDIVHVELDGFRVILEGGEQVAHRHHISQVHRA